MLVNLTNALKFDLRAMVMEERARRTAPGSYPERTNQTSTVSEPASYGVESIRKRASGLDLTIHMDEYDEQTQLQILRFVQQQPKRSRGY